MSSLPQRFAVNVTATSLDIAALLLRSTNGKMASLCFIRASSLKISSQFVRSYCEHRHNTANKLARLAHVDCMMTRSPRCTSAAGFHGDLVGKKHQAANYFKNTTLWGNTFRYFQRGSRTTRTRRFRRLSGTSFHFKVGKIRRRKMGKNLQAFD